eukprot:TRINITY_DN10145_c0_g1_i1.p1 TRINITY_DN10145_c0_g1~~TRINITY_DN10145_c0_g1_i1.p1  ORF type:complete len:153 (+),score=25.20 TRINITY_DN10145_c0_g1_i1:104-562(+)
MNLTTLLVEFLKTSVRSREFEGTNTKQIKRAGLLQLATNLFKWVEGASFRSFLLAETKPTFLTVPHDGDTPQIEGDTPSYLHRPSTASSPSRNMNKSFEGGDKPRSTLLRKKLSHLIPSEGERSTAHSTFFGEARSRPQTSSLPRRQLVKRF